MKNNINKNRMAGTILCLGAVLAVSWGSLVQAADENQYGGSGLIKYPLSVCAVTGEELGSMGAPYVFAYQGREVKLCCKSCLPDFEANPDLYMKKLVAAPTYVDPPRYAPVTPNRQSVETCPVSGRPIGSMGEPVIVRWPGGEIKLCCKECLAKLQDAFVQSQRRVQSSSSGCCSSGNSSSPSTGNYGSYSTQSSGSCSGGGCGGQAPEYQAPVYRAPGCRSGSCY